MALTPKAWIPSPGPPTGSHVPEMSWCGAGATAPFRSLSATDGAGGPFWANTSGEKISATTRTIAEVLKRFSIFEAPRKHFIRSSRLCLIVGKEYASYSLDTTNSLRGLNGCGKCVLFCHSERSEESLGFRRMK